MTEFHHFTPVHCARSAAPTNECETCGGRLTDAVHFHPLTQEN